MSAHGQIVGSQYQEVASAIGCLAKVGALFPLHCERWNTINESSKLDAWEEVQVSFLFWNTSLRKKPFLSSSCFCSESGSVSGPVSVPASAFDSIVLLLLLSIDYLEPTEVGIFLFRNSDN